MTDLLAGMPRWDLLVLTARNLSQHSIFQQQLEQLQLVERGFCRRFLVLADNPPSGCQRIGSGGATLDALIELEQLFGPNFLPNTRVLLLHSGGLSQRIPHVALTGKAFMLMPDSQTLLEHKLRSYKNFLRALHSSPVSSACPGFVFIASADVLEYFPPPADLQPFADVETDLLLITHNSSLQVAAQHGVFIQDPDGSKALWRVLQKPTVEELRRLPGAILKSADNNDEIALTDSCYLVRHRLVADLLRLRKENGSVLCELCCYRDFLCPLGSASKEEKMTHFSADKEGELYRWQRIIWEKMHDRKAQLLCLGPDSFFHFGTAEELLHHFLDRNSAFRHNFLFPPEVSSNLVNCRVEWPEMISAKSFAEWCQMDGQHYTVGDGCILSGLQFRMKENAGAEGICIHPGMCLCTWPIFDDQKAPNGDSATTGCHNYVTVLFHRDDDLKKLAGPEGLRWFGHTIVPTDTGNSLWDCPLFTVQPSAHRSLLSTLRAAAEGPLMKNTPSPLLSIAQVLAKVKVPEMLRQREALLKGGDT